METKQSCNFTCLHPVTGKYVITWVYPGENSVCLQLRDILLIMLLFETIFNEIFIDILLHVTDFKLLDDTRVRTALEIQRCNEELENRVEQKTHDLKKV